jgi:tetratricopeptide (TPR) repeat protein
MDDARTMLSWRHLAACIRRQKRLEEARTMFGEILTRAMAIPGYPPTELAAIINSRAFIDADESRYEEALRGFREALAVIQRELPADDYRIGRSHFNIATMEEKLGQRVEAVHHAQQALEILRKRKGGDAVTVQKVEVLLARLGANGQGQR